jgi:hypothetical protein
VNISVRCPKNHEFEADERLAGGITNCPRCGQATSVPGLRDPFWRILQVVAAFGWVCATLAAFLYFGPLQGVAAGIGLAALIWVVSRAF